MLRRKLTSLLITIIVFAVISFFSKDTVKTPSKNPQHPSSTITQKSPVLGVTSVAIKQTVNVIKVIDGDTIEIEGGQKIRYIGIDTPETKHPIKGIQCFGKEAAAKNKELVLGQEITIEKDVSETDRYGRLLRFVYLVSSISGQTIFINDYLVRQGYAVAATFPPDVKYQEQFRLAEHEARANNRGLWSTCK